MNPGIEGAVRPAAGLPTWLFVAYGGGHAKALIPVALQVQARGIASVAFLALTTAATEVRAAGLPTFGFADLLGPGDDPLDQAARQQGPRLADALAVQAAARAESEAYLGLSYAELEAEVGPQEAASRYAAMGRQAFLPVRVLERAIRRWQPALVLATNSPRAERAALLAARRLGVPSLCLLDLFGLWERAWLVRPDYADAVCVINDAVRASLVADGRPAGQVQVTGNPAFDGLRDPAWAQQGATLRREAGWDGLHVMLYASSPEPETSAGIEGRGDPTWPRRIESHLIEAVQADPRLALWVRRHPSEAAADDVLALGHPRIRVSQGPLHGFLQACDEVVVTVSTVGVEARMAGRAVSQVRGSILDPLSPYLAMGIADREVTLSSPTPWQPRVPTPRRHGVGSGAGQSADRGADRPAPGAPSDTSDISDTSETSAAERVLQVARGLAARRPEEATR